jgi:hypothetical protein
MRTYEELVDLAKECARSARVAISKEIALELWQTALEYQAKAAKLDGGKLPDIGDKPPHIKCK